MRYERMTALFTSILVGADACERTESQVDELCHANVGDVGLSLASSSHEETGGRLQVAAQRGGRARLRARAPLDRNRSM